MKAVNVLPLAALAAAFVLPNEQVLSELSIEDHHQHNAQSWLDEASDATDEVVSRVKDWFSHASDVTEDTWTSVSHSGKNVWDHAFDCAHGAAGTLEEDVLSWMHDESFDGPPPPPHHGPPPPHHGPPEDGPHDGPPPPKDGPPHHGPPRGRPGHGKRPHHPPPHHGPPNETIWQLISSSKYTTKLAKLVSEYDDLVEVLNSTKANYTLFAPTDRAFDKIPEHAPKPSKEQIKAILTYHVLDGFYPAGRVLASHTAPTLLRSDSLGDEALPQRVAFKLTLRGLTVNFRTRIVAINIFGTNGVIHGIDSFILPPPKALDILSFLPGEFSTLELGLAKTGLLEKLNTTKHAGGTLFTPTNFAFKRLGPRINGFLFSSRGEKYLKALLEYHVVPGVTLYSDALYKSEESDAVMTEADKGLFHIDLPTLLKDRSLSVDVARFGGFITIKINGFAKVEVQDIIAKDGVIQTVGNVLIPPKQLNSVEDLETEEELTVEELCERLEPYVAKSGL